MSNGQHVGVYRAVVESLEDPMGIGRVLVDVVSIPAMAGNHVWAMPCVPHAGADRGFYLLPEVGDQVWVAFEDGDPPSPVWMGSFWSPNDLDQFPLPSTRVVKTLHGTTITFDEAGTSSIKIETAGGTTLELDVELDTVRIDTQPGRGITLAPGDGTIIDNADGAKVELNNAQIKLHGWPMKFVPPAPGAGDLESRVAALEAAVQQITQGPS